MVEKDKKYDEEYFPLTYISKDGCKKMWQSSYLEVGTKCCRYPGLRGDENTILVYSALLSIKDNPAYESLILLKDMGMYFYDLPFIAELLNISHKEVQRSIQKLKDLELISVWECVFPSIGIAIKKDLRYISKKKKSIFKVYDRIFFYPRITKKMAIVYSYYLYLSKTLTILDYEKVSCRQVTMATGYYKKELFRILNDMECAALATIHLYHYGELVLLVVDFSEATYEEWQFERSLMEVERIARKKKKEENQDFVEAALQNDLEKFETWVPTVDNNGNDPWDITMGDSETEYVNGWKSKELLRILESSDVREIADQQAGALT